MAEQLLAVGAASSPVKAAGVAAGTWTPKISRWSLGGLWAQMFIPWGEKSEVSH